MANVSSVNTQVAQSGTSSPAQAAGTPKGSALFGAAGMTGANGFLALLMQIVAPSGVTNATQNASSATATIADATTYGVDLATDVTAAGVQIDTKSDEDIDPSILAAMMPGAVTEPVTKLTAVAPVSDDGEQAAPVSEVPVLPADAADDMAQNKLDQMSAQLRAQLAALDTTDNTDAQDAPLTTTQEQVVAAVTTALQNTKTAAATPITTDTAQASNPDATIAEQLNAVVVGGPSDKAGAKAKTDAKTAEVLNMILGKQVTDAQTDAANFANAYKSTLTNEAKADGMVGREMTLSDTQASLTGSLDIGDEMIVAGSGTLDMSTSIQTAQTAQTVQSVATTPGHVSVTSHALAHAVAVQLTQMAQNKETRSLTLQINPPELGKMQVKMSYGRDKSIRADIAVEKSDTFSMLQKDSDTLTQALQDAGLSADAGSLNFTLADQGTFADQSNQAQASRQHANENDQGDELSLIEIKTSQEWSVDPGTGIVRYNLMV